MMFSPLARQGEIGLGRSSVPFLLPDAARKARLKAIQRFLAENKESGHSSDLEQAVALMIKEPGFVSYLKTSKIINGPINRSDLMNIAWAFLYHLLYAKDYVAAAMVLWNEDTFTGEPHCVRLVWESLMTQRMICIIGGGGVGKTYSTCAYFFLEWLADPEWTRIQVASNSQDHLEKNAWGDLVRLHSDASMEMPGKADSKAISLNKKRAQGIFALVLPGGPESKGKLKGAHTKPRPAHPKFGVRSRVFCLIDEAQESPQNIFGEIPNRFTSVEGEDVDHIKFVLTANPKAIFSEFGNCAKPKGGWEAISRADETWTSESGWSVVSIDAMKHENVVAKRSVFPGFVKWAGVQERLKRCHGNWEDPEMFTYVYGKFPPMGLASAVIKQNWLMASQREWIFNSPTIALAGADPAYVGDRPAITSGRGGQAVAWIDYEGNRHELSSPKTVIQIDAVSVVTRGDTQDIADSYMEVIKPLGVEPSGFGIDMTGSRGPHDLIRRQWHTKVKALPGGGTIAEIHGIEFGSSPTDKKIAEEDSATPKEMYLNMACELWFAAAKLFEFDVIGIGKGVDLALFSELSARQGGMQAGLGKKVAVESKPDFKRRTGMRSPDLADSCLIMLHVGRLVIPNILPRAKDTAVVVTPRNDGEWPGFQQVFSGAELAGFGAPNLPDLVQD